jgi:hypothetical protein
VLKIKNPALSFQKPERQGRGTLEVAGLAGLVAVVIVLVPVALGVPAVFMFVPPPVTFAPATLARGVQFTALVIGLGAVTSMSLDGLVKIMLGMSDPALAAVVVFGMKTWDCGEQQSCGQYGS